MASPADLRSVTSYAGYRFDGQKPQKITGEFASIEEALLGVQAYAKNIGLDARDIYFYVVREVVSYTPISKTKFTVTTVTEAP